ncbi:MAG TPA: signal peptidase I [Bacteroides sp.]|nr:signal peptidase I [Bacteroides sp.]
MDSDFILNALKGVGVGMMVVGLAFAVFMIISWWIVLKKAGQPGWAILIPVYNFLILLKIAGKPWWWVFALLLAIIPIVGALLLLVVLILMYNGISTKFGKGAGFTVGLVLLSIVFVPILAFGDAEYTA